MSWRHGQQFSTLEMLVLNNETEIRARFGFAPREFKIVSLMFAGFCREQNLASAMEISAQTVRNYFRRMLLKANCSTKTKLLLETVKLLPCGCSNLNCQMNGALVAGGSLAPLRHHISISDIEFETIQLIMAGSLRLEEVATHLGISTFTARNLITRLLIKTDTNSKLGLALWVLNSLFLNHWQEANQIVAMRNSP